MTFNITIVAIIIIIVVVNIVIELSDVDGQVGGSRGRSQSNATYHPSFQLQKHHHHHHPSFQLQKHPHHHHHHHHHHPFKDQSITVKTYTQLGRMQSLSRGGQQELVRRKENLGETTNSVKSLLSSNQFLLFLYLSRQKMQS